MSITRTVAASLAVLVLLTAPVAHRGYADPPREAGGDREADAGRANGDRANGDEADLGPNQLSPLMRMKLERSKAILEGLAMEDFDKISSSAQALGLLSLESGWKVLQTEEYATQSRDFRRTSQVIAEAARDQDLGRATLGYVALTVRCVECHSYMRKQAAENGDRPADGVRRKAKPANDN